MWLQTLFEGMVPKHVSSLNASATGGIDVPAYRTSLAFTWIIEAAQKIVFQEKGRYGVVSQSGRYLLWPGGNQQKPKENCAFRRPNGVFPHPRTLTCLQPLKRFSLKNASSDFVLAD